MTDDELARAVVVLGVANKGQAVGKEFEPIDEYSFFTPGGYFAMSAEDFVRDPRVAMALMDRCDHITIEQLVHDGEWQAMMTPKGSKFGRVEQDTSLPRAIIAAYVEALS